MITLLINGTKYDLTDDFKQESELMKALYSLYLPSEKVRVYENGKLIDTMQLKDLFNETN